VQGRAGGVKVELGKTGQGRARQSKTGRDRARQARTSLSMEMDSTVQSKNERVWRWLHRVQQEDTPIRQPTADRFTQNIRK
jgi:hypothetical protein